MVSSDFTGNGDRNNLDLAIAISGVSRSTMPRKTSGIGAPERSRTNPHPTIIER